MRAMAETPTSPRGMSQAHLSTWLGEARSRIAPFIHRTPLMKSTTLSRWAGVEIHLKAEPLQKTGSFKIRGIANKVLQVAAAGNARGVITFSAGNAAQALAYAARCANLRAVVVMTPDASAAKVAAASEYGAQVVHARAGQGLAELAMEIAEREGLELVHPCDDFDVMAGHASLGFEILEDLPGVSAIVTAIGGGGMAGGLALMQRASGSAVRIIGVEPEGAPQMSESLAHGSAVTLGGTTIAEGLNPPSAGQHCFELIRPSIERIALVPDDAIVAAMRSLLIYVKLVVEPSGAAALAGVLSKQVSLTAGQRIAVIVSGGNIDLERLKCMV